MRIPLPGDGENRSSVTSGIWGRMRTVVDSLDDSATGAASEKILSRISLKSSFAAKIRDNPTKTGAGRSSVDAQIGTRNSRRVNFPRSSLILSIVLGDIQQWSLQLNVNTQFTLRVRYPNN